MVDYHDLERTIALREPGQGLPGGFYTDSNVFDAEMERIYGRFWLLAGHTSQVSQPGDYFTFEVGRESLIILRDDAGTVRALFNVCRHRGSRICTENAGRVGKLVCPYHQWVYHRDGRLATARDMGDDFCPSDYPLHQAHVRVVAGLIYVSLSQSPPSFDAAGECLSRFLAPHGLDRAKICVVREYEVHANWKLLFENNRECYHCPGGHPEFCKSNYDLGMPGDRRSSDNYAQVVERMTRYWQSHGLEVGPENFPDGGWHRCARVPLRDGYVTESLDGRPVGPVMGGLKIRDTGSLRVITFPNAWCHVNSDNANLTQLLPLGPRRTRARITWLVDADAVEKVDYEPDRVAGLWQVTTEQDWRLCEDTQRGVESSRYSPGPLSPVVETGVDFFIGWYLQQLSGQPTAV